MFGKKEQPVQPAQPSPPMHLQEQRNEQIPFMSDDDASVSLRILEVSTKEEDEDFIFEEVEFEEEGEKKKGYRKRRKYVPCLTNDLAVANLDSIEKAVTSAQSSLCDRVKSYELKHDVDLSNFRNRIARRHNYLVNQSRASGFGAQTAKTFNIQQRMDKRQTFVEGKPEKRRGLAGLI